MRTSTLQEKPFLNTSPYTRTHRDQRERANAHVRSAERSRHLPIPAGRSCPQPSTFNPQPFTLNPQKSTLSPQPSTLKDQPSAPNPQPSTLNPQPSIFKFQPSALILRSQSQLSTLNPNQLSILIPTPKNCSLQGYPTCKKMHPPRTPYSRPMLRVPGGSEGGGCVLMGQVFL